jgi:hypothetical protein
MRDYMDAAWKALNDESDFAAFAPFPVSGEKKPEFVEVGRELDPEILAAFRASVEAVGRALLFPQQLLVEGPGAGNHWSDLLLEDNFLKTAIAPTLEEVLGDISGAAFRPVLEARRRAGANLDHPDCYRIWYDLSAVAQRPDNSALILTGWQQGVSSLKATGAALGLSDEELLELPPGTTEYEHWLETNSTIHVPVEVPAGEPDPNVSPNMTAAVSALPPSDLGQQLSDIDRRLYERLSDSSKIAFAAALKETGRAVMRALPKGELRDSLRDVPLDQVWFRLPRETRDALTPEIQDFIPGDAFEALTETATEAIEQSGGNIKRSLTKAGIPGTPPSPDAVAAAGFLTLALTSLLAERLAQPREIDLTSRLNTSRLVPPGLVRDALRVSSGAANHRGALVLDPNQRPQTTNGSWIGGDGPASGPLTLDFIRPRVENMGVVYTWIHGAFGQPEVPYPDHVELENVPPFTEDEKETVLNGNYPGDHNGCLCDLDVTLQLAIRTEEEAA